MYFVAGDGYFGRWCFLFPSELFSVESERENARPIRDNGVFFSLPNCFSVESERENARPIRENALLSLKCCSSFVVILC